MGFILWSIICIVIGVRWAMSPSSDRFKAFLTRTEHRIFKKF